MFNTIRIKNDFVLSPLLEEKMWLKTNVCLYKMFHLKYGKYNNTQEQLDELKEMVRNGRNTNK